MNKNEFMRTLIVTVVVVASGWGVGYLAFAGIRQAHPLNSIVHTISNLTNSTQEALTIEATTVNPTVPEPSVVHKVTPLVADKNPGELVVMMAGDVMFDRGIRALGERNGYDSLFDESVTSLFKKADIVVANLEGPITSSSSKTLVDNRTNDSLTFTFSPAAADALMSAGITIVSQANNHADNFGLNGFRETQRWLTASGVRYFGNPWNSTTTSPITTLVTQNDITVAFVGYHGFQPGVDRLMSEIKRVSGPNVFTIIMPHWGEEYVKVPSDKLRSYARAFIAAGARAVIGAHPHVVGDDEWIGDVPVYYSLGNLLFDQYFSPEVMRGEIVELHVSRGSSGAHLESVTVHETKIVPGRGVTLGGQAGENSSR